jgi:hypothetical protein
MPDRKSQFLDLEKENQLMPKCSNEDGLNLLQLKEE